MLGLKLELITLTTTEAKFIWTGKDVPYSCVMCLDIASWKSMGKPTTIEAEIKAPNNA